MVNWKIVSKMMPWNVVFLIGGGFALAEGATVRLHKLIHDESKSLMLDLYLAIGIFGLDGKSISRSWRDTELGYLFNHYSYYVPLH